MKTKDVTVKSTSMDYKPHLFFLAVLFGHISLRASISIFHRLALRRKMLTVKNAVWGQTCCLAIKMPDRTTTSHTAVPGLGPQIYIQFEIPVNTLHKVSGLSALIWETWI